MAVPNADIVHKQTITAALSWANAVAAMVHLESVYDVAAGWSIVAGGDGVADYLEVGNTAHPLMRIIFAGGSNPHTLGPQGTANTTSLFANICADITGRTGSAANWKTEDVFAGCASPGLGFMRCGPALTTIAETQIINSAETMFAGFRVNASSLYPLALGPWITPLAAGAGSLGGDYVYMANFPGSSAAMDASCVTAGLGSVSGGFLGKTTNTGNDRGCLYVLHGGTWKRAVCDHERSSSYFHGSASSPQSLVDADGNISTTPLQVCLAAAPYTPVGHLRQLCVGWASGVSGEIVQETVGEVTTDLVHFIGASNDIASPCQGYFLYNKPAAA